MKGPESITTYWKNKIVVPGAISLLGLTLVMFFIITYQLKMEKKKVTEAIAVTIASSLISPLLVGDEIEIRKLIFKGGKVNNINIQVLSRTNKIIDSFYLNSFTQGEHYFDSAIKRKIKSKNGNTVGYIKILDGENSYNVNIIFIFLVLVLLFFVFLLIRITLSLKPLLFDLRKLSLTGKDEVAELPKDFFFKETLCVFKTLKNQSKEIIMNENNKIKVNIAQQVAHDIRSPLAALDMITYDVNELAEEKRVIMRSSVSRIHDIANQLLTNYKNTNEQNIDKKVILTNTLLSGQIESIISEKRTQFRIKSNVIITSCLRENAYGLFSEIDTVEFKRILSNLINNSIEELGEKDGDIQIGINEDGNSNIIIEVKDNGNGIPETMLKELGQKGKTFGKSGGSGLGLYHAKTTIEAWGGDFKILSKMGSGTTIKIILKKALPPKSFVSKINLKNSNTVVIMDDDDSIHQIWKKRIGDLSYSDKYIQLVHFTDADKLKKWFFEGNSADLFLVDYEFLGQNTNGVELIKELYIEKKSILVTSRFEEQKIIDDCKELDLSLLPKGLAAYVPLDLSEKKIVLLDDDELVHLIWKSSAKKNNINFESFSHPKDLLDKLHLFSKDTCFYIDSELSDDLKGEDVIKELCGMDFTNLNMATGYDSQKFSHIDGLSSVIGKSPPW